MELESIRVFSVIAEIVQPWNIEISKLALLFILIKQLSIIYKYNMTHTKIRTKNQPVLKNLPSR